MNCMNSCQQSIVAKKREGWKTIVTITGGLEIYAIYILDSTHIYVGGSFTAINNITNTVRIAMWDSITNTWSALSSGIGDGIVYAIYASDPNNVYIGGSFSSRFQKYNGSTISTVSSSPADGTVFAINGISSTQIYVGGSFTRISGVANTGRIAMWNGSNWSALGSGITTNQVNAISVYNSTNVYVGGSFTSAGGVSTASGVAKWDTTAWTSVGSTSLNGVTAIYAYNLSNIYVGCLLASYKYVAMWNGSNWISIGTNSSINSGVKSVYAFDLSNVYFAGTFTAGISMWNNSSWQNVGEGPGNICNTLTIFNGKIYAGVYNQFKTYSI